MISAIDIEDMCETQDAASPRRAAPVRAAPRPVTAAAPPAPEALSPAEKAQRIIEALCDAVTRELGAMARGDVQDRSIGASERRLVVASLVGAAERMTEDAQVREMLAATRGHVRRDGLESDDLDELADRVERAAGEIVTELQNDAAYLRSLVHEF